MNSSNDRVRTMADIARLAGVSTSTVSRALDDSPLISPGTKARVQAIARAHNYRAHQGARNLRLKRTQTIAAMIPINPETGRLISDPFYLEILGAIANTLADHGYDLLVSRVQTEDPGWSEHFLRASRADGLIVIGRKVQDQGIAKLAEEQAPFIVWGPPLPGQAYCSVGSDGVRGAREAVQHLIQLGRQRIAFVGGDQDETEVHLRYQGYQEALNEAGWPVDPTLVTYALFTSRSGYEAMRRLLDRAPDLDAVFVNSDLMAIGAMEALREASRRVPDDVSVVGYDDIAMAAHCSPPLTTVRQHISRGGELLAQKLLQLIAREPTGSETLSVELVVRGSCGAAMSE
ncbi:MAG: LacI family DNA-binding transcriptional regulator [Anaerolineae bacterium]